MLKIIGLIIVALIVALLIYAATRPDTFRLQRSITINAPPDRVFPFINDFHQWPLWSPWEKMDPNMRKTHSGATQGRGAVYEWDGNKNVGTGRSEIVESVPPSTVKIKLDFFKPFEAHNTAEFTLDSRDGSTNVTWAIDGPQPYMMKVMSIFINSDKMVGGQFGTGLGNLKALA
ncbi:MAG TPA: SRPBCC family protein [Nitrospira sp.]